jgi:2-keto-4-pentenoate hydratase/2-oxohepta-3-ene-1,7-dioic acid hydratase in catechol pathway
VERMRLLTARSGEGLVPAVLAGDRVVPLEALARTGDPRTELEASIARLDVRGLLAADPALERTRRALEGAQERRGTWLEAASTDASGTRYAAPIPNPGKIVCIGLNFRDHCLEQRIPFPERPRLFAKFSNAVVGNLDPVIRPAVTHALDLEVELAVVIGRHASRVAAADADDHIAGYTTVNDVTARDLQGQKAALHPGEHGDGQWLRAKGSDTFLPMGPVIVTPDELGDPRGLRLHSWRMPATGADAGRDIPMQDGTTGDMLVDIPHLVEFVTAVIALEPGDIIVTGTPAGVGVFRDPPVFLEPGDVMRVDIDRIGGVTNPIVDADGRVPDGSPAARLLAETASAQSRARH